MTMSDRADESMRRYLQAESRLPEYTADQWEQLALRIGRAAEPLLKVRRRPSWREELVAFGRYAVPMALAAGVAALVLINRIETVAEREAVPATAFLSALAGDTSQETVLDATLGQSSQTMLLADGR